MIPNTRIINQTGIPGGINDGLRCSGCEKILMDYITLDCSHDFCLQCLAVSILQNFAPPNMDFKSVQCNACGFKSELGEESVSAISITINQLVQKYEQKQQEFQQMRQSEKFYPSASIASTAIFGQQLSSYEQFPKSFIQDNTHHSNQVPPLNPHDEDDELCYKSTESLHKGNHLDIQPRELFTNQQVQHDHMYKNGTTTHKISSRKFSNTSNQSNRSSQSMSNSNFNERGMQQQQQPQNVKSQAGLHQFPQENQYHQSRQQKVSTLTKPSNFPSHSYSQQDPQSAFENGNFDPHSHSSSKQSSDSHSHSQSAMNSKCSQNEHTQNIINSANQQEQIQQHQYQLEQGQLPQSNGSALEVQSTSTINNQQQQTNKQEQQQVYLEATPQPSSKVQSENQVFQQQASPEEKKKPMQFNQNQFSEHMLSELSAISTEKGKGIYGNYPGYFADSSMNPNTQPFNQEMEGLANAQSSRSAEAEEPANVICSFHSNEEISMYCFSCEKRLLCVKCVQNGEHRDHDVRRIEKSFDYLLKKMIDTSQEISYSIELLSAREALLQNEQRIAAQRMKSEQLSQISRLSDYTASISLEIQNLQEKSQALTSLKNQFHHISNSTNLQQSSSPRFNSSSQQHHNNSTNNTTTYSENEKLSLFRFFAECQTLLSDLGIIVHPKKLVNMSGLDSIRHNTQENVSFNSNPIEWSNSPRISAQQQLNEYVGKIQSNRKHDSSGLLTSSISTAESPFQNLRRSNERGSCLFQEFLSRSSQQQSNISPRIIQKDQSYVGPPMSHRNGTFFGTISTISEESSIHGASSPQIQVNSRLIKQRSKFFNEDIEGQNVFIGYPKPTSEQNRFSSDESHIKSHFSFKNGLSKHLDSVFKSNQATPSRVKVTMTQSQSREQPEMLSDYASRSEVNNRRVHILGSSCIEEIGGEKDEKVKYLGNRFTPGFLNQSMKALSLSEKDSEKSKKYFVSRLGSGSGTFRQTTSSQSQIQKGLCQSLMSPSFKKSTFGESEARKDSVLESLRLQKNLFKSKQFSLFNESKLKN